MPTSQKRAFSLADQAYDLLEDRLVNLELAPGSIVSEGTLIEMTGLGRTPVREAMLRFAHQGLVEVLPRRGLLITAVNDDRIIQLLEVRRRLERFIVRLAAVNARDKHRSEMSAIARELPLASNDSGRFVQLCRDSDGLLDECAENPFATAAAAPLRTHCRRLLNQQGEGQLLAETVKAQAGMLRHVARRDPSGAAKASDGVITSLERFLTG